MARRSGAGILHCLRPPVPHPQPAGRDDIPRAHPRFLGSNHQTAGASAIHSRSIKVTVDRYGHLTQDGRERCRQVVATSFEGYLPEELSVGLAA